MFFMDGSRKARYEAAAKSLHNDKYLANDWSPKDILDFPLRLTVLVPAHNEEESLADTVNSLWGQTRKPDRIIVVADNCTDRTPEIAKENGADVFETVNNVHKKGGGLNQCLAQLLPTLDKYDAVLVIDADTVIVPEFIEVAMGRLETGEYDAIGGIFFGEGGRGLIGLLQQNEYVRYSRDIARHNGRVFVLTGTASIFRADLMKEISNQRGIKFPGHRNQVYDTESLTEDNEITLAVKTLGARITSPTPCRTITEVMPTWGDLWRQRMRWQRGAIENIRAYGITRPTFRYWFQQFGLGYGAFALNLYFILMIATIIAGQLAFIPFWIAIGILFIIERTVTAWNNGWRGRVLAATIFVELGYDAFQQAVYIKSLFDLARHKDADWHHIDRASYDGSHPSFFEEHKTGIAVAGIVALNLTPFAITAMHVTAILLLASGAGHIIVWIVAINTLFFAVLSFIKLIPMPSRAVKVPALASSDLKLSTAAK